MRPGRVNTYHNDPFVAAAANNAFVIALFLPPRCSSYRVISQSLFHPCVYLPLPIFDRSMAVNPFRSEDLVIFPLFVEREGTKLNRMFREISKFARVLRSYDVN